MLLDAGWPELLATDAAAAITTLAEEAGRARSAAPVMDLAMLWAAGFDDIDALAVIAGGLVLAGVERSSRFVTIGDDGIALVGADAVSLVPAGGFDPALGLSVAMIDGAGDPVGDADLALTVVAAGRRALASQMAAAAEQMLIETVTYVSARHEYGRAVGSFQSVKHRLADVRVAIAAAQAGVRAAGSRPTTTTLAPSPSPPSAWPAGPTNSPRRTASRCTVVSRSRSSMASSSGCVRGLLLDVLLGNTEALQRELGRRLLTTGLVPRHPALRG